MISRTARPISKLSRVPSFIFTISTRKSSNSSNPFILSQTTDFQKLQEIRPPFNPNSPIKTTQNPIPTWKYGDGDGASSPSPNQALPHIEIDPSTQSTLTNYKLLISAIPRPISLISTISSSGQKNLAPFSYFQIIDHDPPIFVVGFSARATRLKDTRRNLLETGECVINIVSEYMIEAVDATSLDLPYGMSEWDISGLKALPSSGVKAERVKEAVFSVEGRLLEMKELGYGKGEGGEVGALAIIEGKRFWVRGDALNEGEVELRVLRPVVGLGGVSFGRVNEIFELPRKVLEEELRVEGNGLARILGVDMSSVKK